MLVEDWVISYGTEESSVDKISLAFGNWMRVHVASVIRRSGTSRNRNSDSSVPSGQGEATDSPSACDHDKLTNSQLKVKGLGGILSRLLR